MVTAIGLAAIIHAFAIYICGCLADFSEGWKKPHLAASSLERFMR